MAQLWRRDPRLAQQIDDLPIDAMLAIAPSKKGPATASTRTHDGRILYLHSRYDPVKEADDIVNAFEFDDAACIVLCGLGLGYLIVALHRRYGDETRILVGEPDLITLKSALETIDMADAIRNGVVEFLPRCDTPFLHEKLRGDWSKLMLGTRIVAPPVSREISPDFHASFRKSITEFTAYARMSLMTLVRNAGVTCRNIANNLPTYVSTPSLELLHGKFSGVPAVLVAAGPSLARNVEQLRAVQDHVVIIAAQTTLRPLLARGIRPHFVASLDYSELSRQFFDGFEIPDKVVLVAEPKAAWTVIDAFRGSDRSKPRRTILLDSPFAHRCMNDKLGRRPGLESGATVMHLAYYLAEWLGCDPIIFIGQDLAFTGHCYYSPGVAIHRAWDAELGRFCTLEMKEWERIARNGNILRRVKDIDGRTIFTDEQMFTYLQQFERDFAKSTSRIIDATEGGAVKSGAVTMTLKNALEKYASAPIAPSRFDYLDANWNDSSKLIDAHAALSSRIAELGDFRNLCMETSDMLKQLRGLLGHPAEFNRRLARLDELRTRVQRHDIVHQMVREVSQLAEFQRVAADRRIDPNAPDEQKRAIRQLDRDAKFIEALLEGCDRLTATLNEAKARFEDAMEPS